jgi:hypothetical protein
LTFFCALPSPVFFLQFGTCFIFSSPKTVLSRLHLSAILSSCHPAILPSSHSAVHPSLRTDVCHPAILPSCLLAILPSFRPAILPSCSPAVLQFCHPDILPPCYPAILQSWRPASWLSSHAIILAYGRPAILSILPFWQTCQPVFLPCRHSWLFCRFAIQPSCHPGIKEVSYRTTILENSSLLPSNMYFILPSCHPAFLSGFVSFLQKVLHFYLGLYSTVRDLYLLLFCKSNFVQR